MSSRRGFLRTTAGAGLLSCFGDFSSFTSLCPAKAAEAEVTPDIVRLNPAIEPVVRLIENTPREKCFDMMVEQLRGGLPYRQFLAALFLAGIRNVNPQPPGFKFHCVFVIHSVNQMSLDAAPAERLLPLFWALDDFKASQQKDMEEGDFVLRPVKGELPSPEQAWPQFHAAMESWDQPQADRAVVALVRSRGAQEIIEGLWRYGARDYRNIGHKAIFVANTWRTLQTIGWQHAEPALRSLVLGLLDFGKSRRVNDYAFDDQAWLPNVRRAAEAMKQLPGDWAAARADADSSGADATVELLEVMRTATIDESCNAAIQQLVKGRSQSRSVWDAVHLAAGELMMRQPGIFGIHTVTSVNALHSAYELSVEPETRLLMLLQGIGWMCQFRNFMDATPRKLSAVKITELTPGTVATDPKAAVEEILAGVAAEPAVAASKALALAGRNAATGWNAETDLFARAARSLIFQKARDAHDFKYAAAIFEDYGRVSERWHPQMLATAVYHLSGSTSPDSPVMTRAREAVRGL